MNQDEMICAGCGAAIQTHDQTQAGYTPTSALEREVVICQRCFRLNHYNEVQDVPLENTDFTNKLHELGKRNALIVKIVDVFDFEGSWIPGFQRYIGNNNVLLLVNKIDLLPQSLNENKLKDWVRREAKEQGLKVRDVLLISAEKKRSVEEAASKMDQLRNGKDVYITGCTNVGKSTFINSLIQQFGGDEEQLITTSYFPGTTLDMIDIPLDDGSKLYDTPGIINNKQMAHFVSNKELKHMTPSKEIKPRIYQLNEQQTLFIAGLARMDFTKGDSNSFVAYFANDLLLHRTKLEKADELYAAQAGEMLSPPGKESIHEMPELVAHSFHIKHEKTDIVISGLGWITVVEPGASVTVHAPKGAGVSIREAII
ncbi:ribosome biogenesis GTPase YqeH [Salibacterium salarium]|uniref:Ribosome biogenesis GTPase YqeH n=1 Tax=Salibacterium salarium TaxID=284579 RepID=A0A3R9P6V2_9BACI|nr:ribosome biogenesis GTPase YqeH [Salibacterium salarium]RSL31550.1 ribosome biogenesis GTPase YqeH [Salibacterium salarium]